MGWVADVSRSNLRRGLSTMNRVTGDAPLLVQLREHVGSAAVIAVSGEVDTANCDDMRRKVTDLMASDGALHVTLDLRDLTFISSAGIRALLSCRDIAENAGKRLVIDPAHEHVRQVLTICGLTGLLVSSPR